MEHLSFLVSFVFPDDGHYMRDHGSLLTPIWQGRRGFLEMWRLDFLVIRVCYVSRSKALKSWILKKSNCWVLSTATNLTTHTPRELKSRILVHNGHGQPPIAMGCTPRAHLQFFLLCPLPIWGTVWNGILLLGKVFSIVDLGSGPWL